MRPTFLSDFDYFLPNHLIAQRPLPCRSTSRLLCVETAQARLSDCYFENIIDWMRPQDVLVVNNTRVFPARLRGEKVSGARIECLIERFLSGNQALVHLRSNRSPKPGSMLTFSDTLTAEVLGREGALFLLQFHCHSKLIDALKKYGEIPLPPYIKRPVDEEDKERYQTVYGQQEGAVAAPTAGLHFTHDLLEKIRLHGITVVEITLHVGAGTFQPVREEKLHLHKMHQECCEVSQEVCDVIRQCQQDSGRVIAVGTTTLRALETAASNGSIMPYKKATDLFIRPGYHFNCVNVLITNFHLPKSSLLMLVAAFGGYDLIMKAYQRAINNNYRFYSYGDAMMIVRSH